MCGIKSNLKIHHTYYGIEACGAGQYWGGLVTLSQGLNFHSYMLSFRECKFAHLYDCILAFLSVWLLKQAELAKVWVGLVGGQGQGWLLRSVKQKAAAAPLLGSHLLLPLHHSRPKDQTK